MWYSFINMTHENSPQNEGVNIEKLSTEFDLTIENEQVPKYLQYFEQIHQGKKLKRVAPGFRKEFLESPKEISDIFKRSAKEREQIIAKMEKNLGG